MYELRPCPFCGSEAKSDVSVGTPQVWCTNLDCNCQMLDLQSPFLDDLIVKWNTRADNKLDEALKLLKLSPTECEYSWKLSFDETPCECRYHLIQKFIDGLVCGSV